MKDKDGDKITFTKSNLLNEIQIQLDIHRTLHLKMRDFLLENDLEGQFFNHYYPEGHDLVKEWDRSGERVKKILKKIER